MVLLSIFFNESDPRRDHQQIVLYSFCRSSALALHLAVKILLQIFLYEDLRMLVLHTSVGCISPPECQQDRTLLQPILLSENIFNIWHKSSTKHKEVRPDWNDKKTIMQTTRLVSHGRFYQWLRLPFLKKYSIRRFRLWIVLFWTKTSQRLTLYLLSSHR